MNEFRTFFGLEPHATFEDVNADPEIQIALQNLYDSPDMIEMYPGIFIEGVAQGKGKKTKGVGFPGTAGRGVLSDAVTLVRSDRFYTTDYTTATLTNWGLCEAQSDYKTLGGSMFHRLLQRGLPDFFDFNSVYAMQPMYTSAANKEIFQRLKVDDQYCFDPPKAPTVKTVIETHDAICNALSNTKYFASIWSASVGTLVSQKASDGFDKLTELDQLAESKQLFSKYLIDKAESTIKRSSFRLRKSSYQIDIVRE